MRIFLYPLLLFGAVLAAPSEKSLVVSTTEPSSVSGKEHVTNDGASEHPQIYEMDITSNVSNRFATTLVVSKVKNGGNAAKETSFTVILPEKAFISEFVMEIGGKKYKAYVKEKEEAKQIYDQAVASGQSAGHVAVTARDSNKFTVSVNIEPEVKVIFYLTYEELLERTQDQYELILNIRPGQIVKDLNVKVQIDETRPLKFVKTPPLRSGNEISKNQDNLDPSADIQIINSTQAVVKFSPDAEKQRQFANDLGNKESDGLSGQFIVQYDVERDPHGGEVLLRDGYFVHFFAPGDLEPLPKHVLFVLDSSGSMSGRKMEQLKDAMNSILGEIREEDLISILDFGSGIHVWDILEEKRTSVPFVYDVKNENPFANLSQLGLPVPVKAVKENVEKAKRVTKTLVSLGGTFMIGGLEIGLYLAKTIQDLPGDKKYQPIMIFLTDGYPNIGLSSTGLITDVVTQLNTDNNNVPIFSLSFGIGADKDFLRKLSLRNQGFSRHIYEAADASLQLQQFYKQISSPLLSNITFKYNSDVKDVTKTRFPIYFKGSEIVVTGRYDVADADFKLVDPVTGWIVTGPIILKPIIERPVSSLERLWAYLTVKQLLDERESTDKKKELTKKALDLALKYSFVTDITSLVVVKPNETSSVDTQDAFYSGDEVPRGGLTTFGKGPGLGGPAGVQYFALGNSNRIVGSLTTPFIPDFGLTESATAKVPASTTDIPQATSNQTLKDGFPWLASALNPNGTITVAEHIYELGEAHNSVERNPCQGPAGAWYPQPGQCTLLKDCPEAYPYVTDFQIYQQYFCSVENKYAGICCQKK